MAAKKESPFGEREIRKRPSTRRVRLMLERYLASPLTIDVEYIRFYTEAHRRSEGRGALARRAEAHASALERLTPVIREGEPFVGSKTRFVRGAIPYCNYASRFVLSEFKREDAEHQDRVIDLGTGGGIAKTRELSSAGDYELFGRKFLLAKADKPVLKACAEYFQGKCMQDVGDALWKAEKARAEYIEKGWKAGLYTAPHDPAPEGRYVLDFETALKDGFDKIISRMKKKIASTDPAAPGAADQIAFWHGGIRVLEATVRWARNYASEARRLARTEMNLRRRAELLEMARICDKVPAKPPKTFREAMQAFWFTYLAGHIEGAHLGYSPGRFDRYMFPFFRADLEAGKITRAEALELLEALRVKMTEIEYVASFSWEGLGSGNLFQNMILGGLDEKGRPAANALSLLVLQSAINCQTTQPTLSIWYDERLPQAFLRKAVDCVKTGCGFPAWFNTKVYIEHEKRKSGLPESMIRKYAAMGGCTEPTMEGMSYGIVQAGFINHGKLLELAMSGGTDPRTGVEFEKTPRPSDYAGLKAAYKVHLKSAVDNWQKYWNQVMAGHRQTCTLVYSSTLVRDCIERGKSLDDGGARVNGTPTTLSSGLVNVVNALAAVKHIVDDNKTASFDELREACAKNWKGFGRLHRRALDAPKWGNNDDAADRIYDELYRDYCDIVERGLNYLGRPYDPSMLAISTHTPFGKVCGATPDGRTAGESLADGVTSPMPGTDVRGPLAVLHSAGKIDHTRIRGGLHNMKFHPSVLHGSAGSRKLLDLIRTYFQTPGFQIQFNVVDSRMLRDAQDHPDQYRDLIVRVAGFSAFFVELGKSVQDQIIARTDHRW